MRGREAVPTATVVLPIEPDQSTASTLRDLLDTLGPYALRLVSDGARGLDRAVGVPIVHGLGEPVVAGIGAAESEAGGGIVLLPGVRAGARPSRPFGRPGRPALMPWC